MPNINIPTNIISTKTTSNANSAKSGVEDANSDNNSFKEMLSNQMNSSNKTNDANKTEASKEKKNEETKESKETSPENQNTQTTTNTSNTVNPAIIASVFQNASVNSPTDKESQVDTKDAVLDLGNSTSKEKKSLTLALNTELNADKAVGDENQENEDTNSVTEGKSFAAIADKIKYTKPEIIDKVPNTVISNNLTTKETTDAMVSSLTSNDPTISSPFLQTQQAMAQAPVNEITQKFTLHNTVNAYGWTNELANKLTYIVGEKMQSAQLQLNPEHLGPIEVKIQIDDNKQTTIQFSALHADTRQALETAIPQLKSIMTDNGVNLANCSVNPDAFASNMNQQRQQDQAHKNPSATPEKENNLASTTVTGQVSISGSVDLFV